MEMRDLLEKMMKFAGEKVGQKPGDQWRGTDKAPPGKKLVGDSILKDLSKGKTPKSKEQELSEEFQSFLEAEFKDTVDKRPARKNARPARGHEPKSGYKTIKADESAMSEKDIELQDYRSMSHKEFQNAYKMTKTEWINKNKALVIQNPSIKKALGLDEGAEQDPIVAKVVKQMRPGLTGLDMGNEAFLYFAYELGKQRARDAWSDYLPSIRAEYEKGLNESGGNYEGTKRRLKNSDPFVVVDKTLGAVICTSDSLDKAKKQAIEWAEYDDIYTVVIQKDTQRSVFKVNGYADAEKYLGEGWESGPEEYQEPYDDADDAYDRQRQEKIDTEAEKEWAKLPKVSTYKLVGRGPNMEPNYEFGGKEYDTLEAAIEARKQLMSDPKTPHPEHIGISTLTRVVDKEQTDENSVTTPQNKAHADQMMKDLTKLQTDVPNPDPELAATIARRKDILTKQTKDLDMEESRGHKIISTKLKNLERERKFASGELKIPTPQERQAQLKKLEKAKPVKELMATPPQGTANQKMNNPNQAQAVAQATQAMKSVTGSSAPATTLAKALDTASQGRPVQGQEATALQPLMKDMATVAQDPKLAGQFKSLVNQINQAQLKQK